ncbi:hypothetical protein ACFQDE_06730 [Deinococcus caeni]|uniref:hypothetical protein n=1 Tax=Deinococcus caeni TaxID=569127 RepID=UPI003617DD68
MACDTLDVFLGQLAHTHGLDLRVIDARRGDLPPTPTGTRCTSTRTAACAARTACRSTPP